MSSATPSESDASQPEQDLSKSVDFPALPALNESLDLVRRAQDDDTEALNQLFQRYYERVHRIARIRMGALVRRAMEPCDIVNETYIVAARKLGDFVPQDQASIINWLARIAERQIRDAHRKITAKKRDIRRQQDLDRPTQGESLNLAGVIPNEGPSPSTIVANAELKEIYDACVESLSEEHRELILLREYAGASWETICEDLGRPNPHAAQQMYHRAQVKLAGILRARLRQ
ncbi:MAG: RNA polymerase sigma-70 factor (ECF subfamily) [Planctomycetota bacterium]|jgi:RNA polymerase sigma-70 factor (ECF subfamily)